MTTNRYRADGDEAGFQPGSRRRVLANRLGISSVRAMQHAESEALILLMQSLIDEVDDKQRFNTRDLCDWHRRWLGAIYPWAGEYRQLNMGKGGFQFASAHLLPRLMAELDRETLSIHTPCAGMDEAQLAHALAVTHAEFILIHPFREGNGRLARVLNSLMALQAGWPPLDYGGIRGRKKREHIGAIHAALSRNYSPMEAIFRDVLRRSERASRS